jgi:hypothetical protein
LAVDAAAKHPQVEDLFTVTPEDSVDHHLLNKLASFLSAEIIVIPNPVNPHLETHYVSPQRYLNERPPSPRPLILSLAHLHKTSLLREVLQAISDLPRLMVFTETQRRILRLDLDSYNLCVSFFSKKIVYSKPSNYGLKNYCVALSGPPLGLNDYSLAPPTRRLQTNKTASING